MQQRMFFFPKRSIGSLEIGEYGWNVLEIKQFSNQQGEIWWRVVIYDPICPHMWWVFFGESTRWNEVLAPHSFTAVVLCSTEYDWSSLCSTEEYWSSTLYYFVVQSSTGPVSCSTFKYRVVLEYYLVVVFWWSDERWEATEWQRAAEDVSVGVLSRGWLPCWQEGAWEIKELVFICDKIFTELELSKIVHVAVWNPCEIQFFFPAVKGTQTFHQTDVHANINVIVYIHPLQVYQHGHPSGGMFVPLTAETNPWISHSHMLILPGHSVGPRALTLDSGSDFPRNMWLRCMTCR